MTEQEARKLLSWHIRQLTAEWLQDQTANGWDGSVEFIMGPLGMNEGNWELMESEARKLARLLDPSSKAVKS